MPYSTISWMWQAHFWEVNGYESLLSSHITNVTWRGGVCVCVEFLRCTSCNMLPGRQLLRAELVERRSSDMHYWWGLSECCQLIYQPLLYRRKRPCPILSAAFPPTCCRLFGASDPPGRNLVTWETAGPEKEGAGRRPGFFLWDFKMVESTDYAWRCWEALRASGCSRSTGLAWAWDLNLIAPNGENWTK